MPKSRKSPRRANRTRKALLRPEPRKAPQSTPPRQLTRPGQRQAGGRPMLFPGRTGGR